MIKLKSIINEATKYESSRRRAIEVRHIKRLFLTSFSESAKAFRNKRYLRRNLKSGDYPYYFINPKIIERKSKEAENFYTVAVSMLPSWKNYPKRTRSIICTVDAEPSSDYGRYEYYVFPMNNAEFAEVSGDDMWYSMSYIKERVNTPLEAFNSYFPRVIQAYIDEIKNKLIKNNQISLLDWVSTLSANDISNMNESTYHSVIKKMNEILKVDTIRSIEPSYTSIRMINVHRDIKQHFKGDWEEYLDGLLNPEKNGMGLRYHITDLYGDENECWTDSPCILIKVGENINQFIGT